MTHTIRPARSDDYDRIAAVADDWWGRPILAVLPRLFLDHFHRTSRVAEAERELRGFVIGFGSPSEPAQAYIHFVGVHPDERRHGLARQLYEEFFTLSRADGRRQVSAITSPLNEGSIAFHRRLGFTVTGPVVDYNGPGQHRMVFTRSL
jgi:ribosomal protein S18 acetylase RimI-like enzyme